MIDLHNVRYRYAPDTDWVLQDVNLHVVPGETVLLCGASGSGKSTLCRLLNGLIPHFHGGQLEGRVTVGGRDVQDHSVAELYGQVAMIFQNPTAQLFNHTVERELTYGLESLGLPAGEIARRVRESAEAAGIAHLLDRNPHQLSGGEQQLTAVAAALALHPQVLVLDEPYASLDPANVRRLRETLRGLRETLRGVHAGSKSPLTLIIAEHRLEHVAPDADRMVVLHQGRVVLDGPPRRVLARDLDAYALRAPPVVRAGRALGLLPLPLTVREWRVGVAGRGTEESGPLRQALEAALSTPLPSAADVSSGRGVRFGRDDPAIEARGVRFGHDRRRPVLRDLDLAVRRGETLAVVGANGSGKTTLIKHLNGLHRPQQGRVLVLGRDTRKTRVSELARHVGMAFQNANDQFFKVRVRDEIEVGARALGGYDPDWMEELVALFRLDPLLERSPYKLSEGQKKRVAFAAALVARPEVLVLDEPTTGQDWPFRCALGELLNALQARRQTTVLVTHDLEFAESNADRWALLADGQVIACDVPAAVMADQAALRRASLEATQGYRLRAALEEAVG